MGSQANEQYLKYLDGWRGLAIALLLIGHFYPVAGINLGHVGVNLFFVLSGLLMARLLFIKNVQISYFYKRRMSRILPVLFAYLTLVTLWQVFSGSAIDWHELIAAALLINNYVDGTLADVAMPFGHFWSLSVEEHSYILLSLLAIATRKKWIDSITTTGLFSLIFGLIGLLYWSNYNGHVLNYEKWLQSEVSAFGIFLSGFFLLLFNNRKNPAIPAFMYPVLFASALMLHWWSIPKPIQLFFGVGILALLINLLQSAPKFIQDLLSAKPLRQLGMWSFSLYVWQQPFYLYMHQGKISVWIAFFLAITTGIISFYLIENPSRRFLNRIWAHNAPIHLTELSPVGNTNLVSKL